MNQAVIDSDFWLDEVQAWNAAGIQTGAYRYGRLERLMILYKSGTCMKITKTKHGNSLCLALKGRIDTTIVPELEKLLKELLHGVADLTIDLREMDYLSSDGLRVFADAQKTMNKQGFMRVIHVNDKIMKIFEVNGFVDILTIEE